MNETREIKCPLCGAPAIVTITENAHVLQNVATYHYQEPQPAPGPTLYGYTLHELEMVAVLLRQHGVTPEDLLDLKDNFQRAFGLIHAEQERMRKAAIDRALQNFEPAAFPDVGTFRGVFPDIKLKKEE